MTRFEREINGMLGEFWKNDAEKRVAKVREEYESGKITVDEDGVARNCIGRILMDDLAEILEYAGCCEWFDREATATACTKNSVKTIKAAIANHKITDEYLHEMRAAFGAGTTVVAASTYWGGICHVPSSFR